MSGEQRKLRPPPDTVEELRRRWKEAQEAMESESNPYHRARLKADMEWYEEEARRIKARQIGGD